MKVLIAGSKGQLGKDLQIEFDQQRVDYLALDKKELDITKYTKVKECVSTYKPLVIVNCAAYNCVDDAEKNFDEARIINAEGPLNLACVAERLGIFLIHFSSDYVFKGNTNKPYTVEDKPDPINQYGVSKLLGEVISKLITRYCIIRTSWLFSKHGSNFPNKIVKLSNFYNIRAVGDQTSSPTYTKDLARIVYRVMGLGLNGLYHFSNMNHCSRYEWAKFIAKHISVPWHKIIVDEVKGDEFKTGAIRPKFSVLNCRKLYKEVGLVPTWQDATVRFLREIGRWK